MGIALSTTLHTSFDDAVERTRQALSEQGSGVLTEIDMKATLKAKLGEDMEDYLILGACNPPLAHRAVNINRQIGLLLPCNVVVRTDPDDSEAVLVEAMDPQVLVDVTVRPNCARWPTKSTRNCRPPSIRSSIAVGLGRDSVSDRPPKLHSGRLRTSAWLPSRCHVEIDEVPESLVRLQCRGTGTT